jgi:hypothetical protein
VDEEARRAAERAADPWYDQRVELRQREFDGVDFFVHEPGRPPAPRPRLGAYLDAGLTQPELAGELPRLVGDLVGLARDTGRELRPGQGGYALAGQPAADSWWGPSTMDGFAAALRTGRVELLSVSLDSAGGDEFLYLEIAGLPGRADAALDLSVVPSHDLWPEAGTDRVGDALLAVVLGWLVPLRLYTAAVTYDRTEPRRSPWDLWHGTDHDRTAPEARDRLRGYYWANLLTAGHLARLGGAAALAEAAAAAGLVAEPVGGDAVLVRAPGPVTGFGDDQLAAMKELLSPALPAHPYRCYEGYPLRIVPDPGTAFRRVPPGSPRPRIIP